MSNIPLLQPERAENETLEQYHSRLENAKNYVKSNLNGSLVWNPRAQGTYTNDSHDRIQTEVMFGRGKRAQRQRKAALRKAREAAQGQATE